jgi:Zn-finger in Ran binding protein and others
MAAIAAGDADPLAWNCPVCTFRNAWTAVRCDACDGPRISLEAARENAVLELSSLQAQLDAETVAARADIARQLATDRPELEIFPVFTGVVCLCRKHRCRWLKDLVASPTLTQDDMTTLTKEFVLQHRQAVLL